MGMVVQERCDRVVIGGGPAGIGTAVFLDKSGGENVVFDAGYSEASFEGNQRWGQDGLLYLLRNPGLATKLHKGHPFLLQMAKGYVLNQGGHFLAASEQQLRALEEAAQACGFPLQPLELRDLLIDDQLGPAACIGGFITEDTVIDYPGFIGALPSQLVNTRVIKPGTVKRLLSNDRKVTGVMYEYQGKEQLLHCDFCVLTAGAWGIELLHESLGMILPVMKRYKSPVMVFEGELVEKITVFLDNGLTLVPFRGTTLVANTHRVVVENLSNIRGISADMVETIKYQLCAAFPQLKWDTLTLRKAYGCIKTEASETTSGNQDFCLFDQQSHGVEGLLIAWPGKASLLFQLGEAVAAHVNELCTLTH